MIAWKIIQKRPCELIVLFSLILLFGTRNVKIAHDKMIIADGAGYYVYLPAVFIYHDLSFDFFNTVYPKYYPPGYNPPTKNFINEFDGIKVDKYFPGVAILCLPFFLLAHFLSFLIGMPMDGYSPIYQYSIGIAAIFYCWLGLKFLQNILILLKFKSTTIFWAIVSIFIGTNLLYQTIYYPSASHVFLFFLISALAYYLFVLFQNDYKKNNALLKIMLLLALLAITRPQDIIVLFLLPFFGASNNKIISIFKSNYTRKIVWICFFSCIAIVSIVPILWYLQSGKLFLNPYTGEHYYFNNPHFFDALFSFRKGWFLYTPLIAISILGLLKMKNRIKALNAFLYLCLIVFINSCWWSWTYGPTSYSQRAHVDIYFLPAILLAYLIQSIKKNIINYGIKILLVLLCALSLLQTYQFRNGIIPADGNSSEIYFDHFFRLKTEAIYPIPKNIIQNYSQLKFDFEKPENQNQYTDKESFSGKFCTLTSKKNSFSASYLLPIPSYLTHYAVSKIRATAMLKSQPNLGKCTLVLDFVRNGKSINYNAFETKNYIYSNEWTKVQFGLPLPENVNTITDSLRFYFWDDTGTTNYIDDIKIEFITTNPDYELHQ